MMLALLAVGVSVMTTGCRYDKARKSGAGADGAGNGSVSDMNAEVSDISADSGSLADLSANGKSWEELGYTRCTDVEFLPVYFGFDTTTIAPSELEKIDAVRDHLNANSDRVVTVEGNCDERGSTEYNVSLGENRAIVVRNYLIQSGIAAERIKTVSRGEENPAVIGQGEECWSKNRRDEFTIWKK